MQQPTPADPHPGSSSFAGMLAAFAAPAGKRPPLWNDDDIEDDVATLTYERALRAHGRYRAQESAVAAFERPAGQAEEPEQAERLRIFEVRPGENEPLPQEPVAQTGGLFDSTKHVAPQASTAPETSFIADRNLKSSSVTIRLSSAESAQLRQRAAEAGMTISAYLRSCTFEAETLRALVKDTLAQMRSAPNRESPSASNQRASPVPAHRGWWRWLLRLLPRPRSPGIQQA